MATIIPSVVQSQVTGLKPDEVPSVRYESGRLLTTRVPYHRVFRISGPRAMPVGTADLVRLRVERGSGRRADLLKPWTWSRVLGPGRGTPPIESCWVAFGEKPPADFSLLVDRLNLGDPYNFKLSFYRSASSVDVTEPAQRAIDDMVQHYAATRELSAPKVDSILTVRMADLRDRLGGNVVYVQTSPDGHCAELTAAPAIPLTAAQKTALKQAAEAMIKRGEAIQRFSTGRDAFQEVAPDVEPLLARMLQASERESSEIERTQRSRRAVPPRTLPYQSEDLQAIAQFIRPGAVITGSMPVTAEAFERLRRATASPLLTPADRSLLEKTLGAIGRMRSANQDYHAQTEPLKAVESIKATLQDRFFLTAFGQIGDVRPWDAEAAVQKIQIGTAYGGGFGYLNASGTPEDDAFAFVILKFYMGNVDKELAFPWSSDWARLAFNLGAVSNSTVRYRGQTQENAIAGLKPLVGVSFDVQRRIAVHVGGLIFRQPSINPLGASDRQRLRMAPFIGLGFDFDALNMIASNIGPKPK